MRYRANSCISDTEVPVGTTEHFTSTKVPVGTIKQIHYTEVPVGTTGLILILVFQILYLSYRAYTYLTDLELALRNMYLSYGSYTCFTELILVFQILFLYEGTRRYDKSEQIRIISHTRSDPTYTDTDISPS